MEQWLLSIPRGVLVTAVIIIAIVFVLLQDPPHTICRTQIDRFKYWQQGVIYKLEGDKLSKAPAMQTLLKNCKKLSSPGACYGLFAKTRVFLRDFELVSVDCREDFAELTPVKNTLFSVYSLMIRLAWGDRPPDVRQGNLLNWFSSLEISLFCTIKKHISALYGEQQLMALEQKTFKKLPGAENLNEDQIREVSLVSRNCQL